MTALRGTHLNSARTSLSLILGVAFKRTAAGKPPGGGR